MLQRLKGGRRPSVAHRRVAEVDAKVHAAARERREQAAQRLDTRRRLDVPLKAAAPRAVVAKPDGAKATSNKAKA